MMLIRRSSSVLAAALLSLPFAAGAAGSTFRDVLDVPATASPLAAKTLLNGLAAAGPRIVAVGQRGHIVYSDDAGAHWQQAKVPVSADLVAVHFPTPKDGWAVGHDGVVLHSADAGASWERQLDGRLIGELFSAHYRKLAAQGELGPAAAADKLVDEAQRVASQGADVPLLDVWFSDAQNGFVIGAFNMMLRTRDGGKTWAPWSHRVDNPNRLHLYAMRGDGADVYVTGEQGLVLKLDPAGGDFKALATPYKGTYFGLVAERGALLVFGLRGNAYRSADGGRSWAKVETGLQDALTGATAARDGKLVLVSQSGRVLVSTDGGNRFSALKLDQATPASSVLPVGNRTVAIAGARGVRIQSLN